MPRDIKRNCPIGVFDSGIGGLTVVRELMRQLPGEDIVYFGDTARVPYGTKSKESVIRFSKECVGVLLKHKVKLIVVACNTSSSHALNILKKSAPVPVVGVIDPGASKAVAATRNNKIGVIATASTIGSGSYKKKLRKLNSKVKVITQACPLFVPLAEEGWFDTKVTLTVAQGYLNRVRKFCVDTVILGCTHYPLLKPTIQKVLGRKVVLVDSAKEVARDVKRILTGSGQTKNKRRRPQYIFWVSDEPEHFKQLAKRFLGKRVNNVKRV